MGTLNRTLEWMKEDLVVKERSYQLDNQCVEVKKKLSEHPAAAHTGTRRNFPE